MRNKILRSLIVALARNTPAFQADRATSRITSNQLRDALTRDTQAFKADFRKSRFTQGPLSIVARCNLVLIAIARVIVTIISYAFATLLSAAAGLALLSGVIFLLVLIFGDHNDHGYGV
jgi:hypothetical protein